MIDTRELRVLKMLWHWNRRFAAPLLAAAAALAVALVYPPTAHSLTTTGGSRPSQVTAAPTDSASSLLQHRTAKAGRSTSVPSIPSLEKDAVRPAVPAKGKPAKHVAHPVTRPSRKVMA